MSTAISRPSQDVRVNSEGGRRSSEYVFQICMSGPDPEYYLL